MTLLAENCDPEPVAPDNGNFTILNGDGSAYGSVVAYSCFDGYSMVSGSPIVYCGIDPESKEIVWSDTTEVMCVGKHWEDYQNFAVRTFLDQNDMYLDKELPMF